MPRRYSETTLVILSSIADHAKAKSFYHRDIVEDTGASKQMVSNNLRKLVDIGILNKTGLRYAMIDPIAFSNYVIKVTNSANTETRRAENLPWIDFGDIRDATDVVHTMQSEQVEGAAETKQNWINAIDYTIQQLKNERRYLTRHSRPRKRNDKLGIKHIIELKKVLNNYGS